RGRHARRRGLRASHRCPVAGCSDRVLRCGGAPRLRRYTRLRDACGHGRRARRAAGVSKLPAATDELEVKARVADPAAVRRALTQAGATLEFSGAMLDRRLDRAGRLKARDEVLRLRGYRPADGSPAYDVLGW